MLGRIQTPVYLNLICEATPQSPSLGSPKLMDSGVKFPGELSRGRTQTGHLSGPPCSVQAGGPSAGLCQGGWQGWGGPTGVDLGGSGPGIPLWACGQPLGLPGRGDCFSAQPWSRDHDPGSRPLAWTEPKPAAQGSGRPQPGVDSPLAAAFTSSQQTSGCSFMPFIVARKMLSQLENRN